MKENSNERAEPVAGEPNFCENCAMDLLTCDCVVKRPVHLETATDPDCAAPRVWEGDKPHGANYAGWRREVIAAQPAADNAPQAPSAGSVPDVWQEHWQGSDPYKGWSIKCGRDEVVWLGTEISGDDVTAIVMAHNKRYEKCIDCDDKSGCVMNCSGLDAAPTRTQGADTAHRAHGIFRQRPDENGGKEFFHFAQWHNDTIPGDGERVVSGWFVPDDAVGAHLMGVDEMSDVMLLGVLRMPREMVADGIAFMQFVDRAHQAADRIESDAAKIIAMTDELEALRKDAERYRWLRARCRLLAIEERDFVIKCADVKRLGSMDALIDDQIDGASSKGGA